MDPSFYRDIINIYIFIYFIKRVHIHPYSRSPACWCTCSSELSWEEIEGATPHGRRFLGDQEKFARISMRSYWKYDCYNPVGGWLGSRADEGRDKLR